MITVSEADQLLRQYVRGFGTEVVALDRAGGRILAQKIFADRPYPPFNRVAMDGIAIRHASWHTGTTRFRIASTQLAGEAPHALGDPASCIEIMTGAALPQGCDTVVRYEDFDLDSDTASIRSDVVVRAGQNIHTAGSDCSDGALVLDQGVTLGPTHIAALASVGAPEVVVSTSPRLAILATGNELVAVDGPVLPHQIRQSNGHAVYAALKQRGYQDIRLEHSPDDEDALRDRLRGLLDQADVVVVSGGVSDGKSDLVPKLLGELGINEVFHKVRLKPGKPFWFGTSADGQPVFGLPGNPVSALVCLYRFVLPSLTACEGASQRFREVASLTALPRRKNDFTHFLPVRREGNAAHPVPSNGSGDFLSLLQSDGFVEVAQDVSVMDSVPFYSWSQPG